MPATVSVCVVCRDEADRLDRCLASVSWADEILVMDMQSTDGSAEVARRHGARVIDREPHPVVEGVREELAGHATGTWVLVMDPDERVSPGLADELCRIARDVDVDAVIVPRMNVDFGHEPTSRHQRYEPQLRMYRRGVVRWPGVVHALPRVAESRLLRLPERDDLLLVHERFRSVPEIIERGGRYAPAQAEAMLEHGERFTARAMLGAMATVVDRDLIATRAWRDGVPGMMRAGALISLEFWTWAAFWQMSGSGRTPADDRYVRRRGESIDVAWRVGRKIVKAAARLRGGRLETGGPGWSQRSAPTELPETEADR